jgi:DNA-binding transcriptional regulator YiaG
MSESPATRMTAAEYRKALQALGFSQVGFAERLGYAGRSGQKWALGEARVPGAVAVLLRLLLARPELVAVVDGMVPPAPRSRRASGRDAG